jgi:hypothetical protein
MGGSSCGGDATERRVGTDSGVCARFGMCNGKLEYTVQDAN